MTDDERELLALRMIPRAVRLVGAVRESAAEVQAVLTDLDPQEIMGLLVVLAAMVPDDATPSQLLGWCDSTLMAEQMRVGAMTDESLRECHRLFEQWRSAERRGARPPALAEHIRAGEREYQSRRYRERTAYRNGLQVVS